MRAHNVVAAPDSTRFLNEGNEVITVVATHAVKKVVFTNPGTGFLEGFGVGALVGSAFIFAIIPRTVSVGADVAGATLGGGALGGLIGGIIGLVIGHRYEHVFVSGEDSVGSPLYDTLNVTADSLGSSPDDTLDVTMHKFLVDGPTYFTGRIRGLEYRFDKAEATYSWNRTETGVTITVRGTRGMFRRMGVLSSR